MPLLDLSAIRLSMRYGSYDRDKPADLSTLLPTLVADSRTVDTLSEVDWLRLNGNNLTDLTPLLQLTSLTRLDLSDTKVSDLSPLGQLSVLKDLDSVPHPSHPPRRQGTCCSLTASHTRQS